MVFVKEEKQLLAWETVSPGGGGGAQGRCWEGHRAPLRAGGAP